jgi:hypothetical protein
MDFRELSLKSAEIEDMLRWDQKQRIVFPIYPHRVRGEDA